MRRGWWVCVLLSAAAAVPLPASPPQVAQMKAAPPAARPGVPLAVRITDVTPGTKVEIYFKGARAAGWIKPEPGSEAAVAGVRFDGRSLIFASPPGLSAAQLGTVLFTAGIVVTAPMDGHADVSPGSAVSLKTPFGETTTHGGTFVLKTLNLPPTCTLGECTGWKPGERQGCGDRPGANCYLYDSQFLCCTVCPNGC